MKTINLRKKQAEALTSIQQQRAQLNTQFNQLNERESLILGLILEENNIDPTTIQDIKLQEETLIYELTPKKPEKKKDNKPE